MTLSAKVLEGNAGRALTLVSFAIAMWLLLECGVRHWGDPAGRCALVRSAHMPPEGWLLRDVTWVALLAVATLLAFVSRLPLRGWLYAAVLVVALFGPADAVWMLGLLAVLFPVGAFVAWARWFLRLREGEVAPDA